MPHDTTDTRRFTVHARHLDRHHARLLEAESFESAAVAYVEDFHPPLGDEDEVTIVVRELETGLEHCFRIESGQAEDCI